MRSDINAVTFENIDIKDGFWAEKQKTVRGVSVNNIYKRFAETGRFDAILFKWHEGMENKPHIFWDSDVAKWVEGAAYFCEKKRDPKLEKIVDDIADSIEKNRTDDGYFNSYFEAVEPQNRFTYQWAHELYCAGHLLEAGIAYKRATGKDKMYRMMKEYADLIYRIFYIERSAKFSCPGHEEIELALVKLYRESGEKKYLDLSLFFVEQRGETPETDEFQNHLPVRQQKNAVGHAVRACYLYCALADLAKETGDKSLYGATKTLFENITKRRMYVTGAIGQTPVSEAFMGDFELPNQTAYAETCANLSLAMFSRRMSLLEPDAVYADTAELVLFNSFISGMSLDGKSFFYSNIQENDVEVRKRNYDGRHRVFCADDQRIEVFNCSCCPPNVIRVVASVADFICAKSSDTTWLHQYFPSDITLPDGSIKIRTGYPYDGKIDISYSGNKTVLALRIPGWCKSFSLSVNGEKTSPDAVKGYVYLDASKDTEISLELDMPVKFIEANPRVWDDAGRIAVKRGPLVYCLEGVDHPSVCLRDIRLSEMSEYRQTVDAELNLPVLETKGYVRDWNDDLLYAEAGRMKEITVKLIPYFAFANRGESNMIIWTLKNG